MDLETEKWQHDSSPDLTIARSDHSSCSFGDQVYVACGYGADGNMLSSIEMLRMGAQAWELIVIPELTPRINPVFSQIDFNSIAILGGSGNKG